MKTSTFQKINPVVRLLWCGYSGFDLAVLCSAFPPKRACKFHVDRGSGACARFLRAR